MHAAAAINVLLEGADLTVYRAGVFRYKRTYNYPLRNFRDYDLILIGKGNAQWQIEHLGRCEVRPGTVLLLPPGLSNGTAGAMPGPAEHVGIHFNLRLKKGANFFDAVPYRQIVHVRQWRRLYDQALRIATEWSSGADLGREAIVHDLTRALIVELVRIYTAQGDEGRIATDDRVLEVLSRIEHQYVTQWTVAEMGRWVGLSPTHLRALFRSEIGMSPTQVLTARRMHEACKLLAGSTWSIKEVANFVGFTDQLYFSRIFRREIGVSPSEYKESSNRP